MRSLPEACCHTQAAELGELSALKRCRWPCEASGLPPASCSGMERLKVGLSEGDEAHPPSAPRFPPQHLALRRSHHFLGVFHHPIANVFH